MNTTAIIIICIREHAESFVGKEMSIRNIMRKDNNVSITKTKDGRWFFFESDYVKKYYSINIAATYTNVCTCTRNGSRNSWRVYKSLDGTFIIKLWIFRFREYIIESMHKIWSDVIKINWNKVTKAYKDTHHI